MIGVSLPWTKIGQRNPDPVVLSLLPSVGFSEDDLLS